MKRFPRPLTALAILMLPLLILALAGCSDDDGPNDGGDNDGNSQRCGQELPCISAEDCINESMCIPRGDVTAQAYHEEWFTDPIDGKEKNQWVAEGDADLSCHNLSICSADADCPANAAGTSLVCKDGFCGTAAPADGPETVTFRGCVDAFGIGDVTDTMKVALYRADQNPNGTSQWDMDTTQDKDGCKYWGAFEFTDVPVNTRLVLKAYDPNELFITTYKYNVVLWSDLATDDGGTWVFDTRTTVTDPRIGSELDLYPWRAFAISATTYAVILMAVGITDLPETQGAIAGTIRDCGYHELENVRCGVVDRPTKLTYFTDTENPRPDRSRDSSNVNGTFAAIGIEAGTHRVSCLAQNAAGEQVPLGEYTVEVFGHGATILSFDWYPGLD